MSKPISADAASARDAVPLARGHLHFAVITHGQSTDPFWSVFRNGVSQAAKDMGVRADYQAPEGFDLLEMGRLIDAAVMANVSGLIVTIPDVDTLKPYITRAVRAEIPIISVNSGSERARDFPILTHIGQTEYRAGRGAGERMALSGVRRALCINHEVGNVALNERCKGFLDALRTHGATGEVLAVNLADLPGITRRVTSVLRLRADIDGILLMGPIAFAPTLQSLKQSNRLNQIKLATFDLSPETLAAVHNGDMLFAIDQQQYMQGYLSVVLLTLYKTNLNTLPYDVLQTGPTFVVKENVAAIMKLSEQGVR